MTMNKLIALLIFSGMTLSVFAQESMKKVMEKRTREMHRVICHPDKEQWRKFIKENYTQALINKPMRAKISKSDNGAASDSATSEESNLESKVAMFGQLHADFGDSKIISIKPLGDRLEMVLRGGMGMTGTFNLRFDKSKPYLIDGIGVEAGDIER